MAAEKPGRVGVICGCHRNFWDSDSTQCQREFVLQTGETPDQLRLHFLRYLIAGLCIVPGAPHTDCSRDAHMAIDPRALQHGSLEFLERFGQLAEAQDGIMTDEQRAEIRTVLRLKD